ISSLVATAPNALAAWRSFTLWRLSSRRLSCLLAGHGGWAPQIHSWAWVAFVPILIILLCFFFQAEDGIRDATVTGVQTCALPIFAPSTPTAPSEPRTVTKPAKTFSVM